MRVTHKIYKEIKAAALMPSDDALVASGADYHISTKTVANIRRSKNYEDYRLKNAKRSRRAGGKVHTARLADLEEENSQLRWALEEVLSKRKKDRLISGAIAGLVAWAVAFVIMMIWR